MTPTLTALVEAAEKATPGPWGNGIDQHMDGVLAGSSGICVTGRHNSPNLTQSDAENRANATFIALANPAAILELASLIKRLEGENEELKSAQSQPKSTLHGAHTEAERAATAVHDVLIGQAWGALNFILAFYEPGQRHLDTGAWKRAEAGARCVHTDLLKYLENLPEWPK